MKHSSSFDKNGQINYLAISYSAQVDCSFVNFLLNLLTFINI